jgi:uncharacterized protein (TIGR02996 family)
LTGTLDEAAVLARWRETRSVRLADLLCCVPLGDDWAKRIETATEYLPKLGLKTLLELPDDPRTTVVLVDLLKEPAWWGNNSRDLWVWVFEKLVKLRDVRCVPALRAMVEEPPHFFQQKFTNWVVGEIQKVADKLDRMKLVKDDARTRRLADAQNVKVPEHGFFPRDFTKDSLPLLERVWAAPDDAELRSVIGDALQERGDPWGDFIALQREGKPIKELLRAHAKRFGGAIVNACGYHGENMTFVDGFVEACRIGSWGGTTRQWDESAVAPHWATVKKVTFAGMTPKLKWFRAWWASGHLRSLRKIEIGTVVLERATMDAPWRFKTLPAQIREVYLKELALLFKTMPRAERARIVAPPEHPVAALLK